MPRPRGLFHPEFPPADLYHPLCPNSGDAREHEGHSCAGRQSCVPASVRAEVCLLLQRLRAFLCPAPPQTLKASVHTLPKPLPPKRQNSLK